MIDLTVAYWCLFLIGSIPMVILLIDLLRIMLLLQQSIIMSRSYYRQKYELGFDDAKLRSEMDALRVRRKKIADKYSHCL